MALAHVVYTWCAPDGEVLRVGRTTWRRWAGWHACAGECSRRRRARHRFCEDYLTRPQWGRLRHAVDWRAGPVHSRAPVPGRVSWRLVLGDARTARLERAAIVALQPRWNVQYGPARPKLRRVS
jgi:hypothetical protein